MDKIKKYKGLIIIALIMGLAFYWYEWRPTTIKEGCAQYADRVAGNRIFGEDNIPMEEIYKTYDNTYENCLKSRGL